MSLFGTLKKLAVNGGKGGEIDDLKAIIGKRAGLARQNRFVVIMNSPASSLINTDFQGLIGQALSGQIGINDFINDPRDIALLCQSTQIPGRQFNTLEYNRDMYANQIKIPYTYTNEDVTFTFLLTNDYYMKKMFDKWTEAIINSMTTYERSKPEIINASRKKRIALGSGRSVFEVNTLLKKFFEMKKMMKKMNLNKTKFSTKKLLRNFR